MIWEMEIGHRQRAKACFHLCYSREPGWGHGSMLPTQLRRAAGRHRAPKARPAAALGGGGHLVLGQRGLLRPGSRRLLIEEM